MPKTPQDSEEILKVPAFPAYVNDLGHVEAGYVLKLMDIAACLPVLRHLGPGYGAVTACVDRTNFVHPIRRWEIITLTSRLTQVWISSAEIEVTITATNFRSGENRFVATANVVMVGLDSRHQKVAMPALSPASTEDTLRMQAADYRKQQRQTETEQVPTLPINLELDHPVCVERQMTTNDANLFNNVFGGVILDILDEAGRAAAHRHTLGGMVIGVRLDRMSFLEPAFIGETIQAYAIVTRSWVTSLEVQVEVFSYNPIQQQRRKVATAYIVYVGVDPDGQPSQVPVWEARLESQRHRAEAADGRRQRRHLEND